MGEMKPKGVASYSYLKHLKKTEGGRET